MQTFLPFPNYAYTALLLDRQRLGKQRVECKQILLAMSKTTGGWRNHPATAMWRGHEIELARYGAAMCREWLHRGYNDSLLTFFEYAENILTADGRNEAPPPWLGDELFHASHRSNLLRKDPEFYSRYNWTEPPDIPYVWPITPVQTVTNIPYLTLDTHSDMTPVLSAANV